MSVPPPAVTILFLALNSMTARSAAAACSRKCLKPLLQPVARAPICLVLGVQLVEDVCISHRIRDFGGQFRILGVKVNPHHVTLTDPSDVEPSHDCGGRCVDTLRVLILDRTSCHPNERARSLSNGVTPERINVGSSARRSCLTT